MPTTAFRLISIEAKSHRKATRQKELQINHSTTILSSRIKSDNQLNVEIKYVTGDIKKIKMLCRIDTKNELEYYKNGGILQYVLRNMING